MSNGNKKSKNKLPGWSTATSKQRKKWMATWDKHSTMREKAKGGNGKTKAGKPIGLNIYLKTQGYSHDKVMPEETLYRMKKAKKY